MAFAFNGFGTTYYGKADRHMNGSYVATEWVILAYIPLIPIRSLRMVPVSGGMNLIVASSQRFQAQRVPMHWRQVLWTYLTVIGCVTGLMLLGFLMKR